MYPHHEEKIRWDDYGEIIKPEDWIDPSAIANPGEANEDDINIDADDAQDTSDAPTKCVQQTLSLNIKAQIQFIDFEGRSDGESVMKLIQQVYNNTIMFISVVKRCNIEHRVSIMAK